MFFPEYQHHERRVFSLDLPAFLRGVDAKQEPEVFLGDDGWKKVRLQKVNLFGDSNPQVLEIDADQNVVSSRPLTARPFEGHLTDDIDSIVSVTVDPADGLFGMVIYKGVQYDFATVGRETEAKFKIQVDWIPPLIPALPGIAADEKIDAGQALPDAGPFVHNHGVKAATSNLDDDGDSCSGGSFNKIALVYAYSDPSYRSAHSDWTTRITNA